MTSRTASQNGRRSRSKGHAWERDVAALFATLFPERDVRRNIAQTRTARREGCDVLGLPWFVECKVGASPDLAAALEQAERDSDGRPALVIAKQDRRKPVVYARLRTLFLPWDPDRCLPDAAALATPPATMLLTDFCVRVAAATAEELRS